MKTSAIVATIGYTTLSKSKPFLKAANVMDNVKK